MTGSRDEAPPPGGGVFRRMGSSTAGFSGLFGAVETVFAPAARQARDELERQRITGARNPSDTDPPDPADPDAPPVPGRRIAAPGRQGSPFAGRITLRPAGRPQEPAEALPEPPVPLSEEGLGGRL